jgi:hypothetical protein
MGKKSQQNFLNIDSQYNAKKMNQTTQKFLSQGCASLSLSSFFRQLVTAASFNTYTLDE